jgi:hypothetical protein
VESLEEERMSDESTSDDRLYYWFSPAEAVVPVWLFQHIVVVRDPADIASVDPGAQLDDKEYEEFSFLKDL